MWGKKETGMRDWRKGILLMALAIIVAASGPLRGDVESRRIKVLTFNIWGITGADQRAVRIKAIVRKIAQLDPDILAIEEAFAFRHRRLLKKALKKAGYPVDNWRYFRRAYGSGILFISKFPIEEVAWEPYVVNGAWNDIQWLGGKGIAYFRLSTPWGPLDFFQTHAIARMTQMFDENHSFIEGDPDEVDRYIHMYQIDRFIREHRTEGARSVIAAGDFNVCPEMPEYYFLVAMTGFENSFDVLHPGENPSTYSTENAYVTYESSRIDHIFYKNYKGDKGCRLRPVVSRVEMYQKFTSPKTSETINYSDHYGIWTEFEALTDEATVALSKKGLGSRRPASRSHSELTGYSDGAITLTNENFEPWVDFALGMYRRAYKKKNRKNRLLIPMAEIVIKSKSAKPATVIIRPAHRVLLEEKICGR